MSDKKNVYQIVTENIIAMLDKGTVPWRMPWRRNGVSIPLNTWGKPYRGINVFILAFTAQAQGYQSRYWMTYKQVQERGGRVREGEKSTLVVFWKPLKVADKESRTGFKTIPLLRYFSVFNLDQTHDVKMTKAQVAEAATFGVEDVFHPETNEDAEAVIGTYLASEGAPSFDEVGQRACYSPLTDAITVPPRGRFDNLHEFFTTVYHEFVHSTGAPSRLNRKGVAGFDHFGSGQYADEELVAEFGAAFLAAQTGIDNTMENSAAYIASWKKRLQDDPKLLVNAASKAQKAAEYIMGETQEDT